MSSVKFARVDARLIHGQVATAWSNSVGINAIYVVDNPTAEDEFMKMIYTNLQNNYSFKIKVLTLDELKELWDKDQFGKDRVMLLFKDIKHAHEVAKLGVDYSVLNIGGVPKKKDNKTVTDYVALTQEEYDTLHVLADDFDKEVFFQEMPSFSKRKLTDIKW